MGALMPAHVNKLACAAGHLKRCLAHCIRLSGKGIYCPVGGHSGVNMQKADVLHLAYRTCYGINYLLVSSL